MLQPLALDVKLFNIPGGLPEHIESAIARGLPEFKPALCVNDGTFVIAGSGPSIAAFPDEIKEQRANGRPICAINGAHDWLIDQGLEPDLFLSIDPRDWKHDVTKVPQNTIYMLASRCSPIMFDFLKDRYVMVFHAASKEDENAVLRKHKIQAAVGGLSTSGLRAINVGYFMGFRKFVLYGIDSCNAPDGITKRINGALTGQTMDVVVGGPGGRTFICNVAMAKQAEDFQHVYEMMPDITIEARGDGLIAAIIQERKRQGKHT